MLATALLKLRPATEEVKQRIIAALHHHAAMPSPERPLHLSVAHAIVFCASVGSASAPPPAPQVLHALLAHGLAVLRRSEAALAVEMQYASRSAASSAARRAARSAARSSAARSAARSSAARSADLGETLAHAMERLAVWRAPADALRAAPMALLEAVRDFARDARR